MALEINFTRTTNSEGKLVFTDVTGDYDATDNPTGYVAPNLERSDINIVMYTIYGFSLRIEAEEYFPDVATEIVVPTAEDGIYETSIYALPVAYDYTNASQQDLIDNAVSILDFTYPFLSELNAVRRKADLVETYRDTKNCENVDLYEDLIRYIDTQLWGAEEDFCNGQYNASHETMVELNKKLKATDL